MEIREEKQNGDAARGAHVRRFRALLIVGCILTVLLSLCALNVYSNNYGTYDRYLDGITYKDSPDVEVTQEHLKKVLSLLPWLEPEECPRLRYLLWPGKETITLTPKDIMLLNLGASGEGNDSEALQKFSDMYRINSPLTVTYDPEIAGIGMTYEQKKGGEPPQT